jgi:two-component system, OmpR family, response regulator
MTHNVLIIEDNPDIARLVAMHLKDIECTSLIAADGMEGLQAFQREGFDLVILDLMLPGMDGVSVCQKLRTLPGYVPILMLTAKSTELDRVLGLEVGADDYLTKPFSIPELQARIKALFRRVAAMRHPHDQQAAEILHLGELSIDTEKRLVKVGGRDINLTAKEFDLLLFFARNPGRVYDRSALLDKVWGYGHDGYEHTVNSHINRLRSKIEEDPAKPRYVLTVWGVGYKFAERYD